MGILFPFPEVEKRIYHQISELENGTYIGLNGQIIHMQYLLTVTAFYYDTPVFYKVSQISQFEYYAEPTDKHMRCFTLKKFAETWISQGGYTEWLAQQIGKKIDDLHEFAIKN